MNEQATWISDERSSEYETRYQQANNSELVYNQTYKERVTLLNQMG